MYVCETSEFDRIHIFSYEITSKTSQNNFFVDCLIIYRSSNIYPGLVFGPPGVLEFRPNTGILRLCVYRVSLAVFMSMMTKSSFISSVHEHDDEIEFH
jgi:hypothetical protein